jgi:Ser/Thr protein kinase RdoA (MazF antagonist)
MAMVFKTELTESHGVAIAREFSLGPVVCGYIDGGARNSTYLLSGPRNSYVATVLESQNHASAEAYGAFLHEVARCGISTPPPIKTRAGRWVYLVENKPVIVTPFVEGKNAGFLSDAELFELGVLLARVHLSRVSCDIPPTLRIGPSDLSWLTQAKDNPFSRWALRQHARTADVAEEEGPRSPTHGDPFRDNIVVAPDGALVLIDWEDAALDRPVFDLAQAALAHGGGLDTVVDRVECLLAGYNSDRSRGAISIDEALRAALYAGLVVAYGRYRRHLAGLAAAGPYIEMWNLTDCLSRRFS